MMYIDASMKKDRNTFILWINPRDKKPKNRLIKQRRSQKCPLRIIPGKNVKVQHIPSWSVKAYHIKILYKITHVVFRQFP